MIAYPLIDLESHGIGIKGYMDMLEDCIMELLSDFDIYGEKIDNAIGIWIGKTLLKNARYARWESSVHDLSQCTDWL